MRDICGLEGVVPIRLEGAIDADGHVMEPGDIWEKYIEAKYRDRALKVCLDDAGAPHYEIDNKPMETRPRPHALRKLREFGDASGALLDRNDDGVPYGATDPHQRLRLIEKEHLEAALLYPTTGIGWEAALDDVELSQAHCRAYNRWIADFCRSASGRLVAIAHISLTDPEAAAQELERAVKDGCRGAFIASFTVSRRPPGHSFFDPVYAKAQELDVPIGIHPTFEPLETRPHRFRGVLTKSFSPFMHLGAEGVRQAFTTFFDYATFDRFPRLKLVLLESGGGWIGHWLDRLDGIVEAVGNRNDLRARPSEYFARQCYISCDTDEKLIPAMMKTYGEDRFFWASDYPHADHSVCYLQQIEAMVEGMPPSARAGILGENAKKAYGL